MEVYKDINNYPNHEVSNTGKVRNKHTKEELPIKITKDGYSTVYIKENNKYPRLRVHKLVMETFCNKEQSKEINHIDGNKQNNNLDNLEYTTHRENMIHAVENGLINTNRKMSVTDTIAGLTYNARSINDLSNIIGINKVTLIPLIKDSDEFPIADRFVVNNPPEDINDIVNNGGKSNIKISITDTKTNSVKTYNSISAASYDTFIPVTSISKYAKVNKVYKNRYIITKI